MTITIRPATAADAAQIARVRVDCWRSTYRGLVPDAYLDGMPGRCEHAAGCCRIAS